MNNIEIIGGTMLGNKNMLGAWQNIAVKCLCLESQLLILKLRSKVLAIDPTTYGFANAARRSCYS